MNLIILTGNLTRDPEKYATKEGATVCRFAIAVHPEKKDLMPQYYNIYVFGAHADSCEKYLAKGKKVLVIGTLRLEEFWKKDNTKGYSLNVTASKVEFLTPREKSESDIGDISPEDIPFD